MENILFLLTLSVALSGVVLADHWGKWTTWSACSRTCDGGATYQLRKCTRGYRFRTGCVGDSIRYATCNNEPCPVDARDFRRQQCEAYNNEPYGGKYYKWLPYRDRKNPCALYCVAEGPRTLARLAPKVLDGTRCSEDRLDMCINGTCWPVGCDHVLGSKRQFDLCRVCGGNNTCFASPRERYHWVEDGLSRCSATCGVGDCVQVSGTATTGGALSRNTNVTSDRNPPGRTKACFLRKCPPAWKIFQWQTCTHTCGGGFSLRDVRCMDTLQNGRRRWLHDSFCPSPRPVTSRKCNNVICPRWYAGKWSPCSVTCGRGYQYREVVCRHEGNIYCDDVTKPITRKNCSTNFPCLDTADRRYVAEHDENDIQEISLGELKDAGRETREETSNNITYSVIHEDDVQNNDMSTPRFVTSSWGPCSTTCGRGVRRRYVRCKVYLLYLQDIVDLADSVCEGPKAPETEPCVVEPCYEDYEWRAAGLTECSRSCLGGTQETLLHCLHKVNRTEVGAEFCERAPPVPIERKICNDNPCPQRWRIGDFGTCSATCGGGTMSRDVQCIQEFAPTPDSVLELPDFMCERPVPERSRPCNTQHCPAHWVHGEWEQCSVTCGQGVQVRSAQCQRRSADGTTVDVESHNCRPSERPETAKPCNETSCPEIKIREHKMKFFQLQKIPKIRLIVGADAVIFPGTSVVVKCPVRGFPRKKLEWYKEYRRIKKGGRVSVSGKGNLRIRKSRPDKDYGNFTCKAGVMSSNVSILFSNIVDVLQKTVEREKYLLGFVADNASYIRDPFDRRKKPLQFVISDWTECSATCGGGVQRRVVKCEIISNDYFEEFSLDVCKDAGPVPEATRKCNEDICVTWQTGNWSECSADKCVRESYAIHSRSVLCVSERDNSTVNETLCEARLFPPSVEECANAHCKPAWNTSSWSHCSAACGRRGFQARMLTCIWKFTGLPGGRSCHSLKRPAVIRKCRAKKCSEYCYDESEYCSIVSIMKLCRYSNFKRRCCHSCKESKFS